MLHLTSKMNKKKKLDNTSYVLKTVPGIDPTCRIELLECNYYVPSEEELENDENETYEIGSVDPARLKQMQLVLDESQSFVLLSSPDGINTIDLSKGSTDSNNSGKNVEWSSKVTYAEVCTKQCNTSTACECRKKSFKDLHLVQPFTHKKGYSCKICDEKFDKPQLLSHHFRTCHEEPKLICNICGCPCSNDSSLLAHYKAHEPKQFSCEMCNTEYDSARDLIYHKKAHRTKFLYACNKCDASFSSTAEVSSHLRTVHRKPREVNTENIEVTPESQKLILPVIEISQLIDKDNTSVSEQNDS